MTDLAPLYAALKNADAAGDTVGAAKLANYIKSLPAGGTPAVPPSGVAALDNPAGSAIEGNSFGQNLLSGLGRGITQVGRGIGERLGVLSPQDIDASRQMDAPLMSTTGGKIGSPLGSAAVLAPAAFIPGVNTVAGGAALGAASGLAEPTGTGESVLGNVARGAMLGGGTSAAVNLAPNLIKAAVQPFTARGKQNIAGDALNQFGAIGTPAAASTPGWNPTLAEAMQTPGASVLQQSVGSMGGEAGNAIAQRTMANNGAAIQALRGLAGTPESQKLAVAMRDYMAKPLYAQAATDGIDQGMAAALKPQIDNLMERPSMQAAVERAKNIFGEQSVTLAKQGDVGGLQMVKQALDDIIEKAPDNSSIGRNELGALQQTRSDLISTMQDIAPKLREADQQYATFSRPINESAVANAMEDKLVPSLMSDFNQPARMTANNYANAMRNLDQQIPKMTNYPGSTVENTMSPGGMNVLNGIKSDLANRAQAQDMAGLARGGNSATAQNLSGQNIVKNIAGPLGIPQSLAQKLAASSIGQTIAQPMQWAYSIPEQGIQRELAKAILDPKYAQQIAAQAKQPMLKGNAARLAEGLRRAALPAAVGAGMGSQ